MYLSSYDPYDPGLAGLGSKLKKLIKPVVHVAAAVATGGASLAVSAAMIAAEKQKKAQAAAQAQADAEYARQLALINTPPPIAPAATAPSLTTGGTIVPPAATPVPGSTVAPAVVPPVSAIPPMPVYYAPPQQSSYPSGGFDTTMAPAGPAPGQQPAWRMPALLVGGGLLLATMLRGKS